MTTHNLNRNQLIELKERFMIEMVNDNMYAVTFGTDWDEPSLGEIAFADEIVPDDWIHRYFDGTSFVPDDFFCSKISVG